MRKLWGYLGIGLLAAGCAAARPLGVSSKEWAAYRATRVSPSLEGRLAASQRYLRDNPEGAYAVDVRRRFEHAEPIYFAAKHRSAAGLEAYLRALPTGPHADQAAERLAMLRAREDAPDLLGQAYAQTEGRLKAAAEKREQARLATSRWLGHFLRPEVFEAPISAASSELVVAWALSLPAPLCGELESPGGASHRRCAKIVQLPYSVPTTGREGDDGTRELTLEIMIEQDDAGRPLRVTFAGPDLFVRIEEAAMVRPRSATRTAHRVAAVVRAVDLTLGAFEAHVSTDASCRRPVVAPEIVRLACEGLMVVAVAGMNPGDDDRIVVEPLARQQAESEDAPRIVDPTGP